MGNLIMYYIQMLPTRDGVQTCPIQPQGVNGPRWRKTIILII